MFIRVIEISLSDGIKMSLERCDTETVEDHVTFGHSTRATITRKWEPESTFVSIDTAAIDELFNIAYMSLDESPEAQKKYRAVRDLYNSMVPA